MYNPIYTMIILVIALIILLGVQMYRVMPKDDETKLSLLIARYLDDPDSLSTQDFSELRSLINGRIVNIRMMRGVSLINAYIYDKVLITTVYYNGRVVSAEPILDSVYLSDLLTELRLMKSEHQSDDVIVKYCTYDEMVEGSDGRVKRR